MNLNNFILLLVLISSTITAFDPDIDICDQPVLNCAVNTDDTNTFIFKGKYFWETNPLDSQSGIIGYGQLITQKWPQLTEPLIACFTIFTNQFITVFVTKDHWFSYTKDTLQRSGPITLWPQFGSLSLNTMFAKNILSTSVYAIYDNSDHFIIYDFKDLSNPKVIQSSSDTTVKNGNLWFLDIQSFSGKSDTLNSIMQVKAAVTYRKTLVLISQTNYCSVDLTASNYHKSCVTNSLKDLLKCPLDIQQRPTTTPPTTVPSDPETLTTDLNTNSSLNHKNETNSENKSNSDDKSSLIYFIIFLVIVVSVIAIVITITSYAFNQMNANDDDLDVKKTDTKVTIGSIKTIDSETGLPVPSKDSLDSVKLNSRTARTHN